MVQLYKILPKSIFILSTFYFYFFCLPSNFGQTPLNGVYTIGGDNPDFGNFTEAVDSLNLKGVSGSVTFDVRDGTYEGRATITEFANPDGQYSVIFQSESGNQEFVTWKYNDFSAPVEILEIDGADNITFRNITFEASGNNVSAIVLRNEANNNSFENLMISNNTYTGLLIILKSHNISINNCYFSSSIPISTSEANDLTISNNYFEEKDGYSISLRKQDNILISNNVLNNVNGIFLREANNFSVEKNKFTNDGYSIYTIDCNENQGAEGLITNNFIKSTLGNLIKNSYSQ